MAVIVTFTLTNGQAQTVATAVGAMLGHPGVDATVAEVHDWLWALGKAQVMNWQTQQAHQAVAPTPDLGTAG